MDAAQAIVAALAKARALVDELERLSRMRESHLTHQGESGSLPIREAAPLLVETRADREKRLTRERTARWRAKKASPSVTGRSVLGASHTVTERHQTPVGASPGPSQVASPSVTESVTERHKASHRPPSDSPLGFTNCFDLDALSGDKTLNQIAQETKGASVTEASHTVTDRHTVTPSPSVTERHRVVTVPTELDTPEFQTAWATWLEYRKTRKLTRTVMTMNRQLAMLAKLGPAEAISTIERSIEAGWQGLFPAKSNRADRHARTKAAETWDDNTDTTPAF